MDRKAVARQTLSIMEQGYYQYKDKRIDIGSDIDDAICPSIICENFVLEF